MLGDKEGTKRLICDSARLDLDLMYCSVEVHAQASVDLHVVRAILPDIP